MADSILFFDGELGHGLSVEGNDKERVIAKSFLPYFFETDPSPAGTFDNDFLPFRGDNGKDAFELSSSF